MALRQPVAAVAQGGTDARIRFARGGVRKSDQSEAGLLGLASIDFDDDSYCINPEGRGTPYLGKHGGLRPRGSPIPRLPRDESNGKWINVSRTLLSDLRFPTQPRNPLVIQRRPRPNANR